MRCLERGGLDSNLDAFGVASHFRIGNRAVTILYRSMKRLLDLPPQTSVFVCHDYPPQGRDAKWETTVAEQRDGNIHVRDGIGEDEFVAKRHARDATLEVPTLILPSIQVNIRAGRLPPPDDNGVAYLRIPLNALPLSNQQDVAEFRV